MTTMTQTALNQADTQSKARPDAVWRTLEPGVEIFEPALTARAQSVLEPDAIRWIAQLHRALEADRQALLQERVKRQAKWDQGAVPSYLDRDSEAVRGDWQVAPIPSDLRRRRVEITGPVNNAKMVVKMLSRNESGHRADTAMLDFEDSMKPTFENVIDGVENVRRAVFGCLDYTKVTAGEEVRYGLEPDDQAVLMVRVRGLHLQEANLRVDGVPVCGGLMDFVLCMYHTACELVDQRRTPKYYVPKCEHYLEARWWNRLFCATQEALGLPVGTLRATFLIETLPAAFQIEEILYEIRQHAAGLNVGRWDKIFSDIKVLRRHPDRVMADRATIGMNRPWMRDYARRLVNICHRRGAYAIGGMAAFTPGKSQELRAEQTAKVRADKELEFALGHDGCWVSHPYFIGVALECFPKDQQLAAVDPEFDLYPDLLPRPTPPVTLDGLRTNVRVGIAYMKGWNEGLGCIAWDNLMEDLATLEIARAQTWQWIAHRVELEDGTLVDEDLVHRIFQEELVRIHGEVEGTIPADRFPAEQIAFTKAGVEAAQIFTRQHLTLFLTETSDFARPTDS